MQGNFDTAAEIKQLLTADQVARRYGFEPNRAGFISCPFHAGDHTASLKLYPGTGGWHCFGCGAGGSVIDFVMKLYDISFRQAIVRMNLDFNLGLVPGQGPSKAERSRVLEERRREREERDRFRKEYDEKTARYRRYQEAIKAGPDDPLYYEAMRKLPFLDNWFQENPWR